MIGGYFTKDVERYFTEDVRKVQYFTEGVRYFTEEKRYTLQMMLGRHFT